MAPAKEVAGEPIAWNWPVSWSVAMLAGTFAYDMQSSSPPAPKNSGSTGDGETGRRIRTA